MYDRKLAEDGQTSQYSNTSFRTWGMKLVWPFAGLADRSRLLMIGVADGIRRRGGIAGIRVKRLQTSERQE